MTSHIQPRDAGITRNFKLYYRKNQVGHFLDCIELEKEMKVNVRRHCASSVPRNNTIDECQELSRQIEKLSEDSPISEEEFIDGDQLETSRPMEVDEIVHFPILKLMRKVRTKIMWWRQSLPKDAPIAMKTL